MGELHKAYSREELKAHILYKLARRRIWGGKHLPVIYLRSGFPKECLGQVDELTKELINEGFLIQAPKTGQLHVSLNPRMKREIIELIEKYFGKVYW